MKRNGHQSQERNRSTMTEQMFMQTLNLLLQQMDPNLLGTGNQTPNPNAVYYARLDQVRQIPRKLVISAFQGELGPEPLQNMTRFLKKPAPAAERQSSIFAGMMWKEKGNELFKKRAYVGAREVYLNGIRLLLSQSQSYDPTEATGSNTAIRSLGEEALFAEFLDVVACANNIAQCYMKENNDILALKWLMEVHRMYDAYSLGTAGPHYKWNNLNLPIEEFATSRMKAFMRQASIFEKLGNSSGAALAAWEVNFISKEGGNHRNDGILELRDECNSKIRLKKRHPDPEDISETKYTDTALQTRGVWKKLQVEKGNGVPPSRKGFASVVWKGIYYVFGGINGTLKSYSDGWALNLQDLKQGWRKVPYPEIKFSSSRRGSHLLALHEDKAYLFLGRPSVHVLNLITETWSTIGTTTRRGIPWTEVFPGNRFEGYACVAFGNSIYYFGGTDGSNRLGRNALVALDLATHQWDVLSGEVALNKDPTLPGGREDLGMWIDRGKLWIALGGASRLSEWLKSGDEGAGAPMDYSYQDLWSYDLSTKEWVEERSGGNPPWARTEVACTFNRFWNRAIVHGGYSCSLGLDKTLGAIEGAYFGDTFAWNPEAKRWSQVITREFPTYRAGADLFTDEQTGRTYLFGGYATTDYTLSSRDVLAQSFKDLWELRIEARGSNFEEADFEVDERFSQLGPSMRCFTCRSVGRWSLCAGTCRKTDQAAAFCGVKCQEEGWKDHKELNKCRKA